MLSIKGCETYKGCMKSPGIWETRSKQQTSRQSHPCNRTGTQNPTQAPCTSLGLSAPSPSDPASESRGVRPTNQRRRGGANVRGRAASNSAGHCLGHPAHARGRGAEVWPAGPPYRPGGALASRFGGVFAPGSAVLRAARRCRRRDEPGEFRGRRAAGVAGLRAPGLRGPPHARAPHPAAAGAGTEGSGGCPPPPRPQLPRFRLPAERWPRGLSPPPGCARLLLHPPQQRVQEGVWGVGTLSPVACNVGVREGVHLSPRVYFCFFFVCKKRKGKVRPSRRSLPPRTRRGHVSSSQGASPAPPRPAPGAAPS